MQKQVQVRPTTALYQFRLERSGQTKLAGLLALRQQTEGTWGGLLDATGIPLVKMVVPPAGEYTVEDCSPAVCDTRLPEVLGKLIAYIYYTPARSDCSWYTLSCVCQKSGQGEKLAKWKKIGPFHAWQILQENPGSRSEKIYAQMYFSSVRIDLRRIDTTLQK